MIRTRIVGARFAIKGAVISLGRRAVVKLACDRMFRMRGEKKPDVVWEILVERREGVPSQIHCDRLIPGEQGFERGLRHGGVVRVQRGSKSVRDSLARHQPELLGGLRARRPVLRTQRVQQLIRRSHPGNVLAAADTAGS